VASELRDKPAHPFRKEAAQAAAAPPPPPLRDSGVILSQRGLRGEDTPAALVMSAPLRCSYLQLLDVLAINTKQRARDARRSCAPGPLRDRLGRPRRMSHQETASGLDRRLSPKVLLRRKKKFSKVGESSMTPTT
jgi:hypothetical protein